MVKLGFQFPDSSLSLSELLPYWARMMMGFRWESNKIFKAVVISNSIDMMNLPTFGSWPMGIFPNNNMLKYLVSSISPWVVSDRKKNIAATVFNSSTFPIRVIFTLLILVMAFAALLRVPIHPSTTAWANLTISLGISICIAAPFSSLFFSWHEYIIADEIQLSDAFMRQKPSGRPDG